MVTRDHAASRPEGSRAAFRHFGPLGLAMQAVGLVVAYFAVALIAEESAADSATLLLRIAFGAVVLLLVAWAVEAVVSRKHWTQSLGTFVVALWFAYLLLTLDASRGTAAIAFVGLLLIGLTPTDARIEAQARENAYLARHPRYARLRTRGRSVLAACVVALVAAAVVIGVVS